MNETRVLPDSFAEAVADRTPVSLGTRRTNSPHEFYRYPARFSPRFAAAAIEEFTSPGDVVLDPFVGGGTTLVEGMRLGRRTVGGDLNPLATFVSRVKTTILRPSESDAVREWLSTIGRQVRLSLPEPPPGDWAGDGYFKDLDSLDTWRIRKMVALSLASIPRGSSAVEEFCRCIVLRTAQWALDMRGTVPPAAEFREVLVDNGFAMVAAMELWSQASVGSYQPLIVESGLPGLADALDTVEHETPALVVTSPPYPGVYVNYHRWKLRGRREIPAPYWIADRRDGNGLAHYTMSARAEPTLNAYFSQLRNAFKDLARVLSSETIVVQLVGFNDPESQLERYLSAMTAAGFDEQQMTCDTCSEDGRLWRDVPGRRWWTEATAKKGAAPHTAREVVLFHRKSND